MLVIPELSLTGFELDLADRLQLRGADPRLSPIRRAAEITIACMSVVGGPLVSGKERPYLGALVVAAQGIVDYAKIHVHESEYPYFLSGEDGRVVSIHGSRVRVAICADTIHASDAADPWRPVAPQIIRCVHHGASRRDPEAFIRSRRTSLTSPRLRCLDGDTYASSSAGRRIVPERVTIRDERSRSRRTERIPAVEVPIG